jgi:hypothetical protein
MISGLHPMTDFLTSTILRVPRFCNQALQGIISPRNLLPIMQSMIENRFQTIEH